MKVTKLTIKNIGMIADTAIETQKPLIIFYGEIRQGKTTILNAVRWCLGGAFPSDIIRHGQSEAFVELEFDGGSVRREFYVAKDGVTKARSISFVRNGKPVAQPTFEIKRFLNPFLLDQDYFKNMGETERKAYFTEILSVDTTALDTDFTDCDRKASDLRIKVKAYGDIDTTPVELIDEAPLRAELKLAKDNHMAKMAQWKKSTDEAAQAHSNECAKINSENDGIRDHNARVNSSKENGAKLEKKIIEIEKELEAAKAELKLNQDWLSHNVPLVPRSIPATPTMAPMPTPPDTSAVEQKLSQASANAVRHERYKENVKRAEAKKADDAAILSLERRKREIKGEKSAKLKTIADSCGVKGLSFDDDGNFLYEGTTAGMLSTSQIMRLSSDLSALYPEGFGISLLDRGESLGKSIFEFVEKANVEKKTILATIVGERPANTPPEVGVFVVTNGEVK